jgi:predicted phage terminase large subunit-like protein
MKWSIVYESAVREDGTLYFPEKLTKDFLNQIRRTQGVYKYSNQYQNEVVPDDEADFKTNWIRHYDVLPSRYYTFVFLDPAISLNDGSDYTASVVVHVDEDKNWYVQVADRRRITAGDTVRHIFSLYNQFTPAAIGIEDVAYQKALLHFVAEEMQRRNTIIPIKGVRRSNLSSDGDKRANNSKPFRIRSLVPRFEYGKIFLAKGLDDLLLEYKAFPRGSHDDLLDALASIEEIVFYPDKEKEIKRQPQPGDQDYERHYIKAIQKRASAKNSDY